MAFQFELNQAVTVGQTEGEVLARTEYTDGVGEPQYFIEYVHPMTKLPTRDWFPESQVIAQVTGI